MTDKPNLRFAAFQKNILVIYILGYKMPVANLLLHESRILSRRTPRSSEHHATKQHKYQEQLSVLPLNSKR